MVKAGGVFMAMWWHFVSLIIIEKRKGEMER